jgi:DNA segregation ATPase FtsK/SpoIIIE-like protein
VSNTVNNLLADVAGKPLVELLGIDPFNELRDWAPRFTTLASADADISALLVSIVQRMQHRKPELHSARAVRLGFDSTLESSGEMPLIVLVIRELPDPTLADKVLLGEILRTGRALGIRVVMAGQCAFHLRGAERNNFGTVVLHATRNVTETQILLGPVAAMAPAELLNVNDPADRGIGYAVTHGSVAKFRARFLPPALVARIAKVTSPLVPQSLM